MNCPSCSAHNPDSHRFCSECGHALPRLCGACGFGNSAGAKFCGGCGTSLQTEAPQPEPQPAAPPAQAAPPALESEAERRQLTVMFCDLVGSTALSEGLDLEDLRDVLRRYQDAAAEHITAQDGFIARYMGDGLLVYFGYPQAHENDAERAIRAGLDIARDVGQMTLDDGRMLSVRIGIATGQVVVGDIVGHGAAEERAVLGDTPNLAARLQGIAEPGSVVVSETTRALAGGLFQYDDMAPQQLKGIQDDVSAFAVTGESSAYSQSEIAANQSVGSNAMPMVGRDTELEILMLQWKAVTNGEAKTVWVQSDAGMGKSRLIRALERRLDDENHATLSCYCSGAYSNSPYFSLKGGLRTLLNFGADQTMEETASRISDYLDNGIHQSAMIHLLHDQVPDGLPHLPDDPVTARQALVDAFHALLAYLSNSQPVLFVLEDVQWVDPSTRELMVALLQNGGVAGTMFLIATRPEGTMMPPPGAMTMTLSNLSTNAARQIVRFNLDAESGHSEMTDRIVARGGGNPLFLEELGKTMRQSAEHVSIPNTLQDALTARLDNLGNDKALVQAASVIGRSFNTRALMAVTGKSATELEPALDRLSQADILEPGGDSDHPHMFRHALMQETAYHSILRSSRARLHGALAEAMTGELSDLVSTHPELVAFQFAEAGDREQAAVYWERGGRRAANRLAHVEAIEFFEKAVGTLAETDEGSPKELELRTEIIASMRIADQLDAALVQLDRAQDIALAVGSLQEQAKLYTLRGNVLFPVGETAASLAAHEKALDLAREAGDTGLEARALSGLGDACFVAGDLSMSQTYFGQCLSLAQDAGLDDVFIPNLCMAGHLKMYLSDLSGAREDCIKSAEMAATKDLKRAEMIARGSCLAKVLYELGDYEGSSAALHRAIELCHEQGTGRFLPMYYSYLALNCAELDRGADFERYRNETLAALNTTSSIFAGAASLATLATGAAILGKPNEARLYLQQSDPLAMSHVPIHNLMWHGRFGIEASLRLEDWDEAVRYARQLEKLGGENPIPWAVLFARRGVALAARGRDPDDKDAAKLVLEIEAELQHLGNVTSPHRQFE